MENAEEKTKNGTAITVIMAIDYGGRWDISNAVKNIYAKISQEGDDKDAFSEDNISANLSTNFAGDPDLLIRTSGEQRISNFLLWELSYSELHFSNKLWPEFSKEDLYSSIYDYILGLF